MHWVAVSHGEPGGPIRLNLNQLRFAILRDGQAFGVLAMSGMSRQFAFAWLGAAVIAAGVLGAPALAQPKDPIEQMADEIIKRALRDAIEPAAKPQPPAAPDKPLAALPGAETPIPLPEGAEFVDFRGADGKLEFTSYASVATVVAFYRSAMKPLGWREKPSVINRPNMVVLDFLKDGKTVSLTIMQMGKSVNVNANGSGLLVKTAAAPQPATSPAAVQDLEADEKSGLPYPKTNTMNGTERTPFRVVLNVRTSADLQSVLAFYRRELGKRNWTTVGEKTSTEPEQATISFKSPDGPAVLKLSRERDETTIELAIRKTAEATKAGVLPKAGQAKVLFGNMLDKDAVVTVSGKTVKVGPGVGSKAPDGPSLDLPPGKYKFSFKIANGPAQSEDVTVGADETWGLLFGPGGALPLQVY